MLRIMTDLPLRAALAMMPVSVAAAFCPFR